MITDEEIYNLIQEHFPFPSIRDIQTEAIFKIIKAFILDDKKYFILECPTGGGKSAIAITVSRILKQLLDNRSTICTSTIALQDQYLKDFPELSNVMGKTNYDCSKPGHKNLKYDELACTDIQSLKLCIPKRDCPYVKARNRWQYECDYRITNTHFMVEACAAVYSGIEEKAYTQFMVVDEAHTLPNIMISHSSFELEKINLEDIRIADSGDEFLIKSFIKLKDLTSKALEISKKQDADFILTQSSELISVSGQILSLVDRLTDELYEIKDDLRTRYEIENNISASDCNNLSDYKRLYSRLRYPTYINKSIEALEILHDIHEVLCQFSTEEKIIAKSTSREKVEICPVTAKSISFYSLLRKSDKFLFMSATICGMNDYVEELGLDPSEVAVLSMNSPFDIEKRKITYIPIAKFSYANKEEAYNEIIRISDEIIDIMYKYYGKPVRGLIHTATYNNAEIFAEKSKHSDKIKTPKNIRDAIALTKRDSIGSDSLILASPTIYEGIDFKDELARFQIIVKVPYDSLTDPLKKYTMKYNPKKYSKEAVIKLVQAYGRGTRHEEDYCFTFILDANFESILYSTQLPLWVKLAITKREKS